MPKVTHPVTGATWDVSDRAVGFWTGPGGWVLADAAPATPRKPRKPRKPRPPRAPRSTPAPDAGAPDDVPGQGSSTTTHPEE